MPNYYYRVVCIWYITDSYLTGFFSISPNIILELHSRYLSIFRIKQTSFCDFIKHMSNIFLHLFRVQHSQNIGRLDKLEKNRLISVNRKYCPDKCCACDIENWPISVDRHRPAKIVLVYLPLKISRKIRLKFRKVFGGHFGKFSDSQSCSVRIGSACRYSMAASPEGATLRTLMMEICLLW